MFAFLYDPDRLTILDPDGLVRTYALAQSASDTAVVDMESLGPTHDVIYRVAEYGQQTQ